MLSREGKQTDRGAVGAEFIGYNRRRREALLLQEFPHQPNCRPSVPAGLNQEIQDFALTVHGTPEIELPPSNYDDHLVQVPAFGRSWPPTLNPPRIGPTEFQDPPSNCLIRDVETTLGKQVLNVPIAQRETAIEPDGMLDENGRAIIPHCSGRLIRLRRTKMGPRIAFCQGCSDWKAGGMYRVELYARVRRACHVEGMSTREASRVFGVDRKTVRKMLSFSVPPGYRRSAPPRRPKLGPFTGIIDRILEDDRTSHRKQRHTAKRIFDRLRDEYGFTGSRRVNGREAGERRGRTIGQGGKVRAGETRAAAEISTRKDRCVSGRPAVERRIADAASYSIRKQGPGVRPGRQIWRGRRVCAARR